jgi:hypothetical protein
MAVSTLLQNMQGTVPRGYPCTMQTITHPGTCRANRIASTPCTMHATHARAMSHATTAEAALKLCCLTSSALCHMMVMREADRCTSCHLQGTTAAQQQPAQCTHYMQAPYYEQVSQPHCRSNTPPAACRMSSRAVHDTRLTCSCLQNDTAIPEPYCSPAPSPAARQMSSSAVYDARHTIGNVASCKMARQF